MNVSKENAILATLTIATTVLAIAAVRTGNSDWMEAVGFATGAVAVWLTVKENIWNWPIGIVNSAAYVVVFFRQKLYGDGSLQVVYVILGLLGWYMWLFGGERHSKLTISKTPKSELGILAVVGILATWGMTVYFTNNKDAAPFLDALTTVISLIAQYLLTRKYLENWHLWILVDVIYVPLYLWKGLYLTAILYGVFTLMAVLGLLHWLKLGREQALDATA